VTPAEAAARVRRCLALAQEAPTPENVEALEAANAAWADLIRGALRAASVALQLAGSGGDMVDVLRGMREAGFQAGELLDAMGSRVTL
jgi:hypothetical protein